MKKIIFLLFNIIVAAVLLAGCNDKYLDRVPLGQISGATYWNTEQDLQLYNNAVYPLYITGFGGTLSGDGGFPQSTLQPWGVNEVREVYQDAMTDNAAPQSYNLAAANHFVDYLSSASGSDGWNFSNIRTLNFFLDNYQHAQVTDAIKHIYAGEIYFFKAWDYFDKVKLFGDVPWLTHALNVDSTVALTAPRTPRAQVMDSIITILDTAINWLPAKGSEQSGRLNKDVAIHLLAKIGLYEGTFRKYHQIDGYQQFLQIAVDAAQQLISSGHYSIYKYPESDNVVPDSLNDPNHIITTQSYNKFFAQYDYSNNSEIILWKQYSASLTFGSAFSRYFAQNLYQKFGATRNLMDAYLCTDGNPISTSSLYNAANRGDITKEFANRDPRLEQTIAQYGTFENASSTVSGSNSAPYPNIPGLSGNQCPTGYRIAKWFLNDPADWARVTNGMQACPVFRYAETLLIYAEAKCELGQCDQTVLDQTINQLRDRVEMPHLKISNIPDDPELDANYAKYCDYVPSPLLREIRRERRVEMAFEGTRWDDLMRWKAGKFLEIPVLGMKFNQATFPKLTPGKDLYLNDDGYIEPYQKTLPGRNRVFDDHQYYFPIPIQDLVLNPNLTQNTGWLSK